VRAHHVCTEAVFFRCFSFHRLDVVLYSHRLQQEHLSLSFSTQSSYCLLNMYLWTVCCRRRQCASKARQHHMCWTKLEMLQLLQRTWSRSAGASLQQLAETVTVRGGVCLVSQCALII
jgi:hypothetical protein